MSNPASDEVKQEIKDLIDRARQAMSEVADYDQAQIDAVVKAVAWGIYREDRATELAEISVEDTGLGNVKDKITKNQRKTLGTLNDLMNATTIGVITDEPELGITTWAKPVGVVGALTPSTNPGATPANQAMMAIKSANAIIVSPSPSGYRTATRLRDFVHEEFAKIGAPLDLFQVVAGPVSFAKATHLAEEVDLVLVTGDQQNVRAGYRSGTPCIGVGKGNVPVIVDTSADLGAAAAKIALSKCFDNATSCSSENSLIVVDSAYEALMAELVAVGGYRCNAEETARIESRVFIDGNVNRAVVGQPVEALFDLFDIEPPSSEVRFFIVDQQGIGADFPLSGEKLSLVLAVYRVADFDAAVATANQVLRYEGIGHSVGIHTEDLDHSVRLAAETPVGRVLVNQAHTFGNGGGFNNSLPFSLSMGCGTWAGNSISGNLSYTDFYNETRLVRPIDKPEPDATVLFAGLS